MSRCTTNRKTVADAQPWLNAVLLPLLVVLLIYSISSAQAQQDELVPFNIAAQPLASAITAFGLQSGYQVSVDQSILEDLRANAVSGSFAPETALERLLAGTGIDYQRVGQRSIVLTGALQTDQAENQGPVEAAPLMVGGESISQRSAAEDAPFTTPGSTAYISREQIERIPPSSPGDIFREVSGVLSDGLNDGTSLNINIRSASNLNRVRTMVEGTQQETSTYRGYSGADQRTYIDPELIGGVEISKGPGSSRYSTGTTAGIVNIRLLNADDLVQEGRSTGFRLRGGIGGNAVAPRPAPAMSISDRPLEQDGNDILSDDSWFGSFAGAMRSDNFEFVAAYAKRREGNYFAGDNGRETYIDPVVTGGGEIFPIVTRFSEIEGGQEVPNTSEDTESILVKGTLRFRDGQSVEAGFTRYESDFGQIRPSSLNFNTAQFGLNEVENNRAWLRYRWASASDLIDLQANVWRTTGDELGEFFQFRPQESEVWGAEIWNTSLMPTPLGDLSLSYGAEYSRSEGLVDSQVSFNGVIFTPGEARTSVSEDFPVAFDGRREVYGSFLNAVLTPTDWLTLNAGLRYDRFSAESLSPIIDCDIPEILQGVELRARGREAFLQSRDAETPEERDRLRALSQDLNNQAREIESMAEGFCGELVAETKKRDSALSTSAGITVEPLSGLQLFAQYSEGFRPFSLIELGQTVDGPVVVNPDLEPEEVSTWEFGINVLRDGWLFEDDVLRASLVYFNNDYDNFITRAGEIRIAAAGIRRFIYQNIPDLTVSGFETSLYYDMGRFFADINATAFDEAFDLPAQATIDQPEYSGTVTLGTRWFDERLVLGGRLSFFGEPSTTGGCPGEEGITFTYCWEAREIFDLFGSYELNDHLSFNASVENVTDAYYIAPLYILAIPAPGRTFRLSFTAAF